MRSRLEILRCDAPLIGRRAAAALPAGRARGEEGGGVSRTRAHVDENFIVLNGK